LIEGRYTNPGLDLTSVFRQSVQGLAHLHRLDIAHRDIKPQNVLLSMPGRAGEVRAMISDFGLCKKLKLGRMSFSQRSGVAGTEGWIAPEMLLGHQSTTCMVDVFSLGCVYYYMLTGGKHPFGENFHRQANILSGRCDLSSLDEEPMNLLKVSLIEKMICFEPSDRPPAAAILKHPVFWTKEKTLTFLQEVSDRVDKEEDDAFVLIQLERNNAEVLRGEWLANLDTVIREDLRRQRTYRNTLKDLLRALRNKKHHYRELSDHVKEVYGSLPNQFMQYWLNKFPRLLKHTYYAMQSIKYETDFVKYYDKNYDFVKKVTPSVAELGELTSRIHRVEADLFDRQHLHSTDQLRLSNNSLISNWEDIDSDKLTRSNSSSGMLPCINQPSNNSAKDSDRSLLGLLTKNEPDPNEQKLRKPASEPTEEEVVPCEPVRQSPLNFADAVRGHTRDNYVTAPLVKNTVRGHTRDNDALEYTVGGHGRDNGVSTSIISSDLSAGITPQNLQPATSHGQPSMVEFASLQTPAKRAEEKNVPVFDTSFPPSLTLPNVQQLVRLEQQQPINKQQGKLRLEQQQTPVAVASIYGNVIGNDKLLPNGDSTSILVANATHCDKQLKPDDTKTSITHDDESDDGEGDEPSGDTGDKNPHTKRVRKRRKHQKKPRVPRFIEATAIFADGVSVESST